MTGMRWLAALALALAQAGPLASAQEPSGRDLVDRVDTLLWGKTLQGDFEMTIATPRWQRTLALRAWMERPRRSFIRILAPACAASTDGSTMPTTRKYYGSSSFGCQDAELPRRLPVF